ncbi:MAG TPA: hypothetical protein VM681_00210 [Candidatus Thermoplasmatota archaeon]|nr:hypothetical protein [Candidatus Thermoplasmatota archaeon]
MHARLSGYCPFMEQRVVFNVCFKNEADYERVCEAMREGGIWHDLDVTIAVASAKQGRQR